MKKGYTLISLSGDAWQGTLPDDHEVFPNATCIATMLDRRVAEEFYERQVKIEEWRLRFSSICAGN